jgi:hypothetical protein
MILFLEGLLCYDDDIKGEDQCNAQLITRNTKTAINLIATVKVKRNLLHCVMQRKELSPSKVGIANE